jgi:hypothetical protein
MRWTHILLCVGLLCSTETAQAELVMAESLDWIVADSDRVLRGRVAALDDHVDAQNTHWALITLECTETLKGDVAERVRFSVALPPAEQRRLRDARDVIAFLVSRSRYDHTQPSPAGVALTARRITSWGPPPVLRLERAAIERADDIVTNDLTIARTRADILERARYASRSTPARPLGSVSIDAWPNSEAGKALYAGSAVLVTLNIDEMLAVKARTWLRSDAVETRLNGVKVLAFFRGPENEILLRALLNDPGEWTQMDESGTRTRSFPVRSAAWEVLSSRWQIRGIRPPVMAQDLTPGR